MNFGPSFLDPKKCRKAECAVKCVQVVGSSLFFSLYNGCELNIDMADVILEWTLDVSRHGKASIVFSVIIIFRGESMRNN